MPTHSNHSAPDLPVVLHVLHSLEGGGTERALVSLLRGFDPRAMRHVVVTLRGAGRLSAKLGEHVACVPIGAVGRHPLTGLRLGLIARRQGAHVIHARNTGCWFDATLAHVAAPQSRLVLGFHGLQTACGFTRSQRLKAWLGLRAGAHFTSVSRAGARQLQREARVPADRITILPNGIDSARFAPPGPERVQIMRHALELRPADTVVGIVGSLTRVKDHALLIDALTKLAGSYPDLKLLVVGDGPLRETLADQLLGAGLARRVRFTGSRDDVPDLLVAMDVFVCCSRSEGMSNAVLEAMAAGLPIIATDVGDNAELLGNGEAGRVIPASNLGALVGAMKDFLQSPGLRRRYGHAARRRTVHYDFPRTLQAYERFYASILEGEPPLHPTEQISPIRSASRERLQALPAADDRELADVVG